MGTDFLDELGETLTRTAKGLGEKAESFYETQKIRNKIASESRIIDKIMADLGNILYRKYQDGETLDAEQKTLCEQIHQHMERIVRYKELLADRKGQKICSCCERSIDQDVAFCPYCGTACTSQEEEKPAEAVEAEAVETEVVEAEEAVETVEAEETNREE